MTLRSKVLLIISVAILVSVAVLYATLQLIILRGFLRTEEQVIRRNVSRGLAAVEDVVITLNEANGDWAPWDDTYSFIRTRSPDFISNNLGDSTFANLRLNLMAFYDDRGHLFYARGFDWRQGKRVALPAFFRTLPPGDLLLRHPTGPTSSRAGLAVIDHQLVVLSSRPISTSNFGGPTRGTLIMGRSLDAGEVRRLSQRTHLDLTLLQLDALPADLRAGGTGLSPQQPIVIRPISANLTTGYGLLRDIYGRPTLVLRMRMDRPILEQGRTSVRYLLFALLVLGLFLGGVSLLVADRLVVARLARLSEDVARVGESGDASARVRAAGTDELHRLAEAINLMLDALERSQKELQSEEARYRSLFEAVTEQRERLRTMASRVAEAEEVERQRFARELHDQVGQNISALGLNLNYIQSLITPDDERVGRRLTDSIHLVEQTGERIRDVMADLRPPVLDDYGLVAALTWLGTEFSTRTGIRVAIDGVEPEPRLAAAVEVSLYRIAQEALANVAKHARADHVVVSLHSEKRMVRLVIEDDGQGFDPQHVPTPGTHGGWGLSIMTERATAAGGSLRAESSPSHGTRIIVEVAE